MSKLDQIIIDGLKKMDQSVERVIFRHTYAIAAMKHANSLYYKGKSGNDVPVSRIHLEPKQAREIMELLSVSVGLVMGSLQ